MLEGAVGLLSGGRLTCRLGVEWVLEGSWNCWKRVCMDGEVVRLEAVRSLGGKKGASMGC